MSAQGQPPFASAYRACLEGSWTDGTPTEQVRFVVLDTETTGLDPRRDRLITIGAVAVRAGEIQLGDSFEVMLPVAYNSASVTVHGITREEAREGTAEAEALQMFLDYLRDGVIVGHHIKHDVDTLNYGYERQFGLRLQNRFLDTMDLALHLQRDVAFSARPEMRDFSLDALCHTFGVAARDRHTAGGDAFITAQVFLRLLRIATRLGRETLGALCEPYVPPEDDPA